MLFLMPNQQCPCTEGKHIALENAIVVILFDFITIFEVQSAGNSYVIM